jgi:hypothetical protein
MLRATGLVPEITLRVMLAHKVVKDKLVRLVVKVFKDPLVLRER